MNLDTMFIQFESLVLIMFKIPKHTNRNVKIFLQDNS